MLVQFQQFTKNFKKIIFLSICFFILSSCSSESNNSSNKQIDNNLDPPIITDKIVEINGKVETNTLTTTNLSYQINFLNDYLIEVYDIDNNLLKNIKSKFLDPINFNVNITLDNSTYSKIIIIKVKHISGYTLFQKIIGRLPSENESKNINKIVISNIKIDDESTIKSLVILSDKAKIPSTLINSTNTGITNFDNDFNKCFNDDNNTNYINSLKTAFNTIIKTINLDNVRISEIKKYFLLDLNTFLNSFVEICNIYEQDEKVKKILVDKPQILILNKQINNLTQPYEVNNTVSNIKSKLTKVAPIPVISPKSGLYKTPQTITIVTLEPNLKIKYTLDGSEPTETNGLLYDKPFVISNSLTIKAIAFGDNIRSSSIVSEKYEFDIPIKNSPPIYLNYIAVGSSLSEMKNIYDNNISLIQTINTLNPYFEIVFKRNDFEKFELTNNLTSLKIKLRITKTINNIPDTKTFVFGKVPLDDELNWNIEFTEPVFKSDRIVFNVKQGQTFFTTDSIYNIQLLELEGVSYKAAPDAVPFIFILSFNVSGTVNIKTTSENKTAAPIISPVGGLYLSLCEITISSPTLNAKIYYTDDDSIPTSNSKLYTAPFIVEKTTKISAIAIKEGLLPSDVTSAIFTIKTADPIFKPDSGVYNVSQQIELLCDTKNARIYYTLDNSEPSEQNGILYQSPFTINKSVVIKAKAFKNGTLPSDTITKGYTIVPKLKVETPILSLNSGTYVGTQSVSINCNTSNAIIKFTLDGSNPLTSNTAQLYSKAIIISENTTLNVIAIKEGFENSDLVTAKYFIKVTPPIFEPLPGDYIGAQYVSIKTLTSNASIYYTLDGSEPTISSNLYNDKILISSTTTIKAIAIKTNLLNSDVVSATYRINEMPKVSDVIFNPEDESFIGKDNNLITLTTPTMGAKIYYTTNGSIPSKTNGTLYTVPFKISSSVTIKAIAIKDGMLDSNITMATYRYIPKVTGINYNNTTKVLSWSPCLVPNAPKVKYYIFGKASAFGQEKEIKDPEGTEEVSINANNLIPPEYSGIPINVTIRIQPSVVTNQNVEIKGEESDEYSFIAIR